MRLGELSSLFGKAGLIALKNKSKRKVHIFYSRNMLAGLFNLATRKSRNYTDLYKDRNQLEVFVLETKSYDEWDRNVRFRDYVYLYKASGWTLYDSCKVPKLTLNVELDKVLGVVVSVRDKAYRKLPVGIFKTMDEAKEWVDIHYPDREVNQILFKEGTEGGY
jgi:hypothetical protein